MSNYYETLDERVQSFNYNLSRLNVKQNTTEQLFKNSIPPANRSYLDEIFNQESPYKFPPLIICDDENRKNQNNLVYLNYMDIIDDGCNRYNIRNLTNSGSLQLGYARNIDLDSHLKNINYYADKCYYDNYKMVPIKGKGKIKCDPLESNKALLYPDYKPVGRDRIKCINERGVSCANSPPNDKKEPNNVRERYDFSEIKLVDGNTCFKSGEKVEFKKAPTPTARPLNNYSNEERNSCFLQALNSNEVQHQYYDFFEQPSNGIVEYPPQRLFNNITRRNCLPNFHNLEDIAGKCLI